MILRKMNLQTYLYPFDSIVTFEEPFPPDHYKHAVAEKVEMLLSDFKSFIDLEHLGIYEPVIDEYPWLNVYNKRNRFHFPHDFPNGKTIAASYPMVKAKYDRRIQRLFSKIAESHNVLAVYLQDSWDQFDLTTSYMPDEQLVYWNDSLNKKFPNTNIHFCFLEHSAERKIYEIEKIQLNEKVMRFRSNHSFTRGRDEHPMIASAEIILLELMKKETARLK